MSRIIQHQKRVVVPDSIVLPKNEYLRICASIEDVPQDKSRDAEKKLAHERSRARARGWHDSFDSKQMKKQKFINYIDIIL
jgi:hypothetical protein